MLQCNAGHGHYLGVGQSQKRQHHVYGAGPTAASNSEMVFEELVSGNRQGGEPCLAFACSWSLSVACDVAVPLTKSDFPQHGSRTSRLLDPQTYRVPCAANNTRLLHFIKSEQRKFGQ